ncbi:MAG: InlB B-repeat-containing protein, partial [Oscillospiraceae bacterium]
AAGVAADTAGNTNTAATQLSRTYDSTSPTVTGVSDGSTYTSAVTPTFTEGTATLKKDTGTAASYTSGIAISENGSYILTVTDTAGNIATINFTVSIVSAPDAPQIVSVVPGNAQAIVTFNPSVNDGGSAITGYYIRVVGDGSSWTMLIETSPYSPYTKLYLTNGEEYTFSVAAYNGTTGAYSTAVTALIGRADKAILSTTIGELSGGNIINVPSGIKVSNFIASLTVSDGATVEIIDGTGGAAVTNQTTTNVTSAMKIKVTAENGTVSEKTISLNVPKYTVTFNSNGGSSVSALNDIDEGSTISAPAAPTKSGYTFAGWYKESTFATAWSFASDTVTATTTLYAKWRTNSSGGSTNDPTESTPDSSEADEPEDEIIIKETPASIKNEELIKVEEIGEAFTESVEVRLKDDPETKNVIEDTLQKEFGSAASEITVFPLDISLYIKGTNTNVQPAEGTSVKITCPIPEELLADKDSIRVVCIIDGKAIVLETKIIQIDDVYCVQFTASHFSPYAFVVDKANTLDNNVDDSEAEDGTNPKTGRALPATGIILALTAASASFKFRKKK